MLLSKISFSQDTSISANQIWLHKIEKNAISNYPFQENFHSAPHGFALYFSKVDSLNVPYLVYVPKNYDSSKPHPLIVFLHGGVSIDSFQYKNASFASWEPIFTIADKNNDIVLYPFARKDFGWVKQQAAFENIILEISQVEQTYNINKGNVFLGGMSDGGSATFWFITHYPQIFTAFYAFSPIPKLYHSEINFKNITENTPLYSINAKDDEIYPFSKVKSIYEQHKKEAPGWHFDSLETGDHGFIYGDSGLVIIATLFDKINVTAMNQEKVYDSIRQVLLTVDISDQKYRNQMDYVRKKYGGGTKEMKSLFKNMAINDSANLVIIVDIISKYGWLGAKEIGDDANSALFMVIQHNDLKTQEKYLPVLRQAVKEGNAKATELALLEDRVALKEGKRQIYGSQLSWNLKTNTYIILPMIDPDKIDERRKAVGLSSYADYLKGFDITWNLEQYKKELPEIEKQFNSMKPPI